MRGLLLVLLMVNSAWADEPSLERQEILRNMLKNDCGACHGLTLKGGLGPPLNAAALADKNDEVLMQTILNGRIGTPMPPWKQFITEQETLWLIRNLLRNRK